MYKSKEISFLRKWANNSFPCFVCSSLSNETYFHMLRVKVKCKRISKARKGFWVKVVYLSLLFNLANMQVKASNDRTIRMSHSYYLYVYIFSTSSSFFSTNFFSIFFFRFHHHHLFIISFFPCIIHKYTRIQWFQWQQRRSLDISLLGEVENVMHIESYKIKIKI